MIDTKYTEVLPCKCDAEECDYKQQWVDAGSLFRIPEQVFANAPMSGMGYKMKPNFKVEMIKNIKRDL